MKPKEIQRKAGIPFYPINPNNEWAKLPRWKKKRDGFFTYLQLAVFSLWEPEATDAVIFHQLKDQFLEPKEHL